MKISNKVTIVRRNFGHWDFYDDTTQGRAFRLRGTPGDWFAMDERAAPYPSTHFKSFPLCLAFIMEKFVHEDLMPDPEIPGNNVPLSARDSLDQDTKQ